MEKTIKTTGVNNVLIAIPYLEQVKMQNIIHRVQPLVKISVSFLIYKLFLWEELI